MALKPLKAKRLTTKRRRNTNLALSGAASMRAMGETPASELSASAIAKSKGIDLPDLEDLGKGSQKVVEAITDTLAMPQRNVVSLVQGDGGVNPYSEEAEKYDPSDALELDGLAGFAADVVLDPINLVPGAGILKTGIKAGAKGLSLGTKAARAAIDEPEEIAMRSLREESKANVARERKELRKDVDEANRLQGVERRAGSKEVANRNVRRLRRMQESNVTRIKTLQEGGDAVKPTTRFKSTSDEIAYREKQNKSLDREIDNIAKSRREASKPDFKEKLSSTYKTKRNAQERRSELDNQSEQLDSATAAETMDQLDSVGRLVDQAIAPEAQGAALYLRTPFTNIRTPIATIKSEKIAEVADKVGKVPGLGKAMNAVSKSFNTRSGIGQGLYEGGRGAFATGAQKSQEEVAPLARLWDKMSKNEKASANVIARSLYEQKAIKGADPTTWRNTQQKLLSQADQARSKENFDQADKLQEVAERAGRAANEWDNLGENARNFYLGLRKYYDEEAVRKVATGELKAVKANYVPSFDVAKDGKDALPYVRQRETIKDVDSATLEKLRKGLPDDFDIFDSFRAAVSETNHVRYSRVLARAVGARFGRKSDPGEGWVEFKQGRGSTGERLWVPKEVDESLTNLIRLGSSGRSQNELVRGVQKGVSKWKILAYSINPGHFLVDTIGDLWNMSLRLGAAVVNPDRMARVLPAQRDVENYFKALEKGDRKAANKLAAKRHTLGGHDHSVRDLANAIQFASIRDTGYSVADIGDYVPRPGALFRKKRVVRSATAGMQVLGNKRDNLGKRLAFLLAADVRGKRISAPGNALLEAGRDVRIALFDYSELTPFEKSVARNAVPFYTWTRKNVPFQLRSIAERPALTIAPFKLQENLAKQETNEDYLIPDYMREKYLRVGQLPGPVGALLGQKKNQPFYLNPTIPSFDLGIFQNARGGTDFTEGLGMLNPMIKAPFELGLESTVGTKAPVQGSVFSNANDKGIPFLGRKGEYLVKSFLGQPGSVTVNTLDETRDQSNRVLPSVGMLTGIRGSAVDPVKQQERAELQVRDEQRRRIQLLQDLGYLPTSDEIEALRNSQGQGAFASSGPQSRRRLQMRAFGQ